MEIGNWPSSHGTDDSYREIKDLGLERNLAELEAFGYTIIRDALTPKQTERARDATVRAWEIFWGRKVGDLETESGVDALKHVPFLLYKDPVFEEVVLNPRPLALTTYLLGKDCVVSNLSSHVKGPGGTGIALHSDNAGVPAPYAAYAHVANSGYALTDYTVDKGCLAMVPGSHRFNRPPEPGESAMVGNSKYPHAVPIEAPAGSAIVWHGNTWHGSYPRTVPGLRINLALLYARPYMAQLESYRDRVPAEVLERHGRDSRLAQLLGLNVWAGWGEEGPPGFGPDKPDADTRRRMRVAPAE